MRPPVPPRPSPDELSKRNRSWAAQRTVVLRPFEKNAPEPPAEDETAEPSVEPAEFRNDEKQEGADSTADDSCPKTKP